MGAYVCAGFARSLAASISLLVRFGSLLLNRVLKKCSRTYVDAGRGRKMTLLTRLSRLAFVDIVGREDSLRDRLFYGA